MHPACAASSGGAGSTACVSVSAGDGACHASLQNWGHLGRFSRRRLTGIGVVAVLAGGIVGVQVPRSVAVTVTTSSTSVASKTTSASTFPLVSLNGASCAGRGCVAVGEEDLSEQRALPFVERWAGGAWVPQAVPQPSLRTKRTSALNAVSCWSARGCVAVGEFFPSCCDMKAFAEEWTGSSWKVQRRVGPQVSPGYQLYGVSCPAVRACVAVGNGSAGTGNTVSLIERWDGVHWIRDPSPNPKTTPNSGQYVELPAVSCAAPSSCVAIGSYANGNRRRLRPLAEIDEGGEWTIQSPVNRGRPDADTADQLDSISCPTSTECVAVGESDAGFVQGTGTAKAAKPLVELWNGQSWMIERVPAPAGSLSSLNSVSCGSPASCTALGEIWGNPATLFAEHWNGHRWRLQTITIPTQITDPGFVAISCVTTRTCTAVGAQSQADPFIAQTVAGHWTVRPPS